MISKDNVPLLNWFRHVRFGFEISLYLGRGQLATRNTKF